MYTGWCPLAKQVPPLDGVVSPAECASRPISFVAISVSLATRSPSRLQSVFHFFCPSRDCIMRSTTLRSCNDKFQQFAGWAATSAENRLVPQVQFLGRLSFPLCNDSARVETMQITVGVPQLQFSWVVRFLQKIFDTPAVVCSSTRWSMSLLCCAMVFPQVQSVSLSVELVVLQYVLPSGLAGLQ